MNSRKGLPDKRGNNRDRKRRKEWMLVEFGDGKYCRCTWCPSLLDFEHVEADRLIPGGPYKRDNIIPACRTCNAQRQDKSALEYAKTAEFPLMVRLLVRIANIRAKD